MSCFSWLNLSLGLRLGAVAGVVVVAAAVGVVVVAVVGVAFVGVAAGSLPIQAAMCCLSWGRLGL